MYEEYHIKKATASPLTPGPWESGTEWERETNPDRSAEYGLLDRYGCLLTLISWAVIIAIISVVFIMTSCSTPKIVEQHHHHYSRTDTAAVQATVDTRLSDWRERIDSSVMQFLSLFRLELTQSSQEHEVTTETVTTATDSLGREIRTEQRRTERTLAQQQQQTEQRLTHELETRISHAVDSLNAAWLQRFEAMQATTVTEDSTTNVKKTDRQTITIWQNVRLHLANIILIALAIAALAWFTRRRFFSKQP